jgi:hypothetical protein
MKVDQERAKVVKSLIEFSSPIDTIANRIHQFDWDYEGPVVELRSTHVADVLRRFIKAELSASEIEKWAELIEGREDISFEEYHRDWIDAVIHELANPSLTERLDFGRAKELLGKNNV